MELANSVTISLSQMTLLRWLTFLRESQSVILIVLLFWTYFFLAASICSTMAFPPLGNAENVVVSVSIDFSSNSKRGIHFIAWLMTILVLMNASGFCEYVWVGIDVYIPHRKYQVKSHSSPWFSASFAAAIVHRNHFFHFYQKDKSSDSKVKFRQASNHCKRVLEVAKFAYANKTKESITSQKLGSHDFWRIANSVLSKSKSAWPRGLRRCDQNRKGPSSNATRCSARLRDSTSLRGSR